MQSEAQQEAEEGVRRVGWLGRLGWLAALQERACGPHLSSTAAV